MIPMKTTENNDDRDVNFE